MKILLTAGVTIALTLGVVAAFHRLGAHGVLNSQEPEAPLVRVQGVERGDLIETISAPGEVQPRTKVTISAKVIARIIDLPHQEGDRVTSGNAATRPAVAPSVLVRLDAKDLEAALRSAKARYDSQAAQITVAAARIDQQRAQIHSTRVVLADLQRDLKRQVDLLDSKDVSQQSVDQAQAKSDEQVAMLESAEFALKAEEANLGAMRHSLDAADADIARAREDLSYTVIDSPIDGTVTRVKGKVGELVVTGTMNNPGTVIMEVADLSQILVVARVDEAAIGRVRVGQRAEVRIQAYPDEIFGGVVESVALDRAEPNQASAAAARNSQSNYYETKILLTTRGRPIFCGLNADVSIEVSAHKNILKVPSQAVLGRPADELPSAMRSRPEVDPGKTLATVVYRLVDGRAVATPVTVGPSDETHTVITSGVSRGDAVIVGPYKLLEPLADAQKVREEGNPTTRPTTAKVE